MNKLTTLLIYRAAVLASLPHSIVVLTLKAR